MSMPSSRLDVATSAGSRPALSSSSIWSRCSRAMLPWWARTSSSPASSLSRWARRSESRRLLVKTIVLRWLRISSRIARVDRRPDARPQVAPRGRAAGLLLGRQELADGRHVVDRDDDLELERLARAGVDDRRPRGRARSRRGTARSSRAAVAWRTARSADRRAFGRPSRLPGAQRLEPLEAEREVRAALGAGDGVDLVDDDVLDVAQDLARGAGQHQVERLGRRDQDVGRVAGDLAPVLGGRVAGPAGDRDVRRLARPAARPPGRSRSAARGGCARCRRSAP